MTATDSPFGYLLVHFIEDPDGYAEKIYMDLSDGDIRVVGFRLTMASRY